MGALPQGTFRPRLREDVRFVECPDGAYVHSSFGACTVRGPQAYAWLTRLAPALTGERTLGDLTSGLPDDKRGMIERLVGTLAEQRFVVDARAALPHGLTLEEQTAYAAEITFIGYALDSPELRFERHRRSRLVLAGSGPILEAVLESCVSTGCRDVLVICGGPRDLDRVAEAARRDPAQRVRFQQEADLGEADVLLQVSTEVEELKAGARAAAEAGVVVGQALVRPDEVWLSPIGSPHTESAWLRLSGLDGARPPAAVTDDLLIGPVPSVVAAMMSLARFSYLTGLDPVPARALTRIDLRTLDTSAHAFLPFAAATRPAVDQAHGPPRPTEERRPAATWPTEGERPAARWPTEDERPAATRLAEGERPAVTWPTEAERSAAAWPAEGERPAADLLAAAGELVDSRTGVIGVLDEQELSQTPLSTCRAIVSDPYGIGGDDVVYGWAEDRAGARLRCLLAALAAYGTRAVPLDAEVVWGVELPSMRPRAVAVRELPAEAAAGLTWAGAVTAALLALGEARLAAALPAELPFFPLPEDDPLVKQLTLAGELPEVGDATAAAGFPAYVWSVPGEPPLVSTGLTSRAALRDGLERVLLRWQHGVIWERSHRWGDDPSITRDDLDRLAKALPGTPVVVPLHHDRDVARILPHLVQVVICDD
ncbi:hypothetical protein [Nonomuraea soli]|uniref:hypothetical protein n=1 Tax=Nonomuraea soli TaxID=1032476 RepID=UPI0015EC6AE7|nr:hypothetical protein [Nonomuraea soli]